MRPPAPCGALRAQALLLQQRPPDEALQLVFAMHREGRLHKWGLFGEVTTHLMCETRAVQEKHARIREAMALQAQQIAAQEARINAHAATFDAAVERLGAQLAAAQRENALLRTENAMLRALLAGRLDAR